MSAALLVQVGKGRAPSGFGARAPAHAPRPFGPSPSKPCPASTPSKPPLRTTDKEA